MNKQEEKVLRETILKLESLLNNKEDVDVNVCLEPETIEKFEEWKELIKEDEEIHPLQEKYAKLLVQNIKINPEHLTYNVVLPMQSGKSGLIGAAAKLLLLEELDYELIYICSLSDKDYWDDVFSYYRDLRLSVTQRKLCHQQQLSKLILAKPSELRKPGILDYNKKYIIFWDECHYGDGDEQGAAKNLMRRLLRHGSIVVGVSATSFGIQTDGVSIGTVKPDQSFRGAKIIAPSLKEMEKTGYKGVSYMLKHGNVSNVGPDLKLKDDLNDTMRDAIAQMKLDYLKNKKHRIAVIRGPNEGRKSRNTKMVRSEIEDEFRSVFAGVAKVVFLDIVELDNGYIIPPRDTIIVYYTKGGLRAGKRMKQGKKSLTPYISFLWESSTTHVSAPTQGLAGGRVCGYSDNSHIRIYCNDLFLRFYASYEEAGYHTKDVSEEALNNLPGRKKKLETRTFIEVGPTRTRYKCQVEIISGKDIAKYIHYPKRTLSSGNSNRHVGEFQNQINLFNEFKNEEGIAIRPDGFEKFVKNDDGTERELRKHGLFVFDHKCEKDVSYEHASANEADWELLTKSCPNPELKFALLYTYMGEADVVSPEIHHDGYWSK